MDSKDPDAKPLPVDKMMVHHFLYYTRRPRRSRPGRLPRRRVPRRARGGAPERALRRRLARRSMRARYGIRNATADGRRPAWTADRDGHEPLQAAQALLRAHEGLVHDRAAHAGLSADDRQLRAPGQRHGLRRAGRRRAGLDVRGPLDLDGAVQRPHPRRRLASPRRRDCTRRCAASPAAARCSTPRPTTARTTTRTTRSARSCTSRGRSRTARSARCRASRSTAGEVLEREARALQRGAARGGDGLLGA